MAADRYDRLVFFNGIRWSAPLTVNWFNQLVSVSCGSPSYCSIIDEIGEAYSYSGGVLNPPVKIEPVSELMLSVSCPTINFCAAIDNYGNAFIGN